MTRGTIIYVGGFELPDKNAAAQRVISNGKLFMELGYNVVFVGVDKSSINNSHLSDTKMIFQGFDCWSIKYPSTHLEWFRYLTEIDFIREISMKYSNVEVIIAYNYPSLALGKLSKYCIKCNIKIIADCTEWYNSKRTSTIFRVVKGFDSFLRMRILHKKMDGIIVISKYLENYYSKCNNVVRLPPLVDINEEKWSVHHKHKNENIENDRKLNLVYSGSPGIGKDKINIIIDALFLLGDVNEYHLDVIGVSETQFISEYPNYGEKIRILDSKIKFVGRVSHGESIKALIEADFSIFIRDRSRMTTAGFPTKFVESVTCSTPVITSKSSDLEEYFYNNSLGFLVSDSSAEELAKVLVSVFQNQKQSNEHIELIDNEIFHYRRYIYLAEKLFHNL